MIKEMKELLPDTYYILLSGYQEFDYVKKPWTFFSVVDYPVKPVNKVSCLLEKIGKDSFRKKVEKSQTLSQELDETGFTANYLSGKDSWWIDFQRKSRASLPFLTTLYILDWQIFTLISH